MISDAVDEQELEIWEKTIDLQRVSSYAGHPDVLGSRFLRNVPFRIALGDLWFLYRGIHRIGLEDAWAFVNLGHMLSNIDQYEDDDIPRDRISGPEVHTVITGILEGIATLPGWKHYKKYGDPRNMALSFTYGLLRDQLLTYEEAATVASLILKKPIHPDSWRIRIARWAKQEGLEPVQFRRGRPRKSNI
jgi:hypothetical protein